MSPGKILGAKIFASNRINWFAPNWPHKNLTISFQVQKQLPSAEQTRCSSEQTRSSSVGTGTMINSINKEAIIISKSTKKGGGIIDPPYYNDYDLLREGGRSWSGNIYNV